MPLWGVDPGPASADPVVDPDEVLVPMSGEAIPGSAAAATQTAAGARPDLVTPGQTPTAAADGVAKINPLFRRLRQDQAFDLLAGLEQLQAAGLGANESLADAAVALRQTFSSAAVAPPRHPGGARRAEAVESDSDFNHVLEEVMAEHYRGWLERARQRVRRAVVWVLGSMLDDAASGRAEMEYEIPPGPDDTLHDPFPEWLSDERGAEALRQLVAHELSEKGFRVGPDSLEERRSGQADERVSFRLTYSVPHPPDVPAEQLARLAARPSPGEAARRSWESKYLVGGPRAAESAIGSDAGRSKYFPLSAASPTTHG
eukprot:TRINITY_DN3026_c0_g1_i1.p1 TRINITY_DN3026_c0_g1~~TRINITY_DN3026_c0_g1_i1.p1  ORF type:complete len:316 (+),score=90.87 TRINITY_DN3026_c0_g1_i1:53-1000(+)